MLQQFHAGEIQSSANEQREIVTKAIEDVVGLMSGMFGREETKDCNVINFDDNMVLVEFPQLAGTQQVELEEITLEFL